MSANPRVAIRRLFAAPLAAVVLLTAACGSSVPTTLTTSQVVASLRDAGFHSVSIWSNGKMTRTAPPPEDPKAKMVEVTAIMSPASKGPMPFSSLYAVRLSSAGFAQKSYEQGYSPAAVKTQIAEARRKPLLYAGILPKHVRLSAFHTTRICNVILASYNPRHDAAIDRRVQRVLATLREGCG